MNEQFGNKLDDLVHNSEIAIDRARGTNHTKFSDYIYPHDYGHIAKTCAGDGMEIDCWIGAKRSSKFDSKHVDGIIVTIDSHKKDSEIKVLIICAEDEMKEILKCHNRGSTSGMLVVRNI